RANGLDTARTVRAHHDIGLDREWVRPAKHGEFPSVEGVRVHAHEDLTRAWLRLRVILHDETVDAAAGIAVIGLHTGPMFSRSWWACCWWSTNEMSGVIRVLAGGHNGRLVTTRSTWLADSASEMKRIAIRRATGPPARLFFPCMRCSARAIVGNQSRNEPP